MATFRGFAHVQYLVDGEIPKEINLLDQWNVLRDGYSGAWYWNPEARNTRAKMLGDENKIDPDAYVIRVSRRPVNEIALIKFLRQNLSAKDWDGFVEIYGQPTPDVIMPQGATDSQKSSYEAAGIARSQGRCVAWPNGTQIDYPAEVRGNAPFAEYLKWCDEQMVLSGTGGLLSMLSMPTGIGSGASETHDAAFQSIARFTDLYPTLQTQIDTLATQSPHPDAPAALLIAYSGLMQYGYANGLV
jgi:hypothetical protein